MNITKTAVITLKDEATSDLMPTSLPNLTHLVNKSSKNLINLQLLPNFQHFENR